MVVSTIVARLYHSEASSLQDGRVIVSGSDPQDGVYPEEYRVEMFHSAVPPQRRDTPPRHDHKHGRDLWAADHHLDQLANWECGRRESKLDGRGELNAREC